MEYRRTESGFYVLPQVVGDRVTLEIGAFDSDPAQRRGATATSGLETVVTGQLGEWIPLGGATTEVSRRDQDLLSRRDGDLRDRRDLSLRVLEID